MSDLISRQAAINAIENTDCELTPDAWDELTNAIMKVQTIDAVPVVRCKDCVYGKPFRSFAIYCAKYGLCDFESYCAFGERRKDDRGQ